MDKDEQRLVELLSSVADVISIHDEFGTCQFVTESCREIFGFAPEALIGNPTSNYVHEEDYERLLQAFAQLQKSDRTGAVEYRLKSGVGRDIWVETTARAVTSNTGDRVIVATTRDISERKAAEFRLAASEDTYRTLINLLPDTIAVHSEGKVLYVNPAGLRALGADHADDVVGKNIFSFIHPSYHELVRHRLQMISDHGRDEPTEQKFFTLTGATWDVETTSALIPYNGKVAVLSLIRDITQRKNVERQLHEMNYQLQRLSTHDALTNVGNRRYFDETLDQALVLQSDGAEPMSLLMLDIDFFKLYNDTYGHPQGDACLCAIAELMIRVVGNEAVVTRYGGEEFAVLVPLRPLAQAIELAEEIRREVLALELEHRASPIHSHVTVSIGVGYLTGDEASVGKVLIRRADMALYYAKEHGRNQIAVWSNDYEFTEATESLAKPRYLGQSPQNGPHHLG